MSSIEPDGIEERYANLRGHDFYGLDIVGVSNAAQAGFAFAMLSILALLLPTFALPELIGVAASSTALVNLHRNAYGPGAQGLGLAATGLAISATCLVINLPISILFLSTSKWIFS